MDSQEQLKRTHVLNQAEKPIKIHHPEEEEHHEKGPAKVLKKVKEKAKKIKKALTKHGHSHEHDREEHIPDDHDLDEEDDEDDYDDERIHGGAPVSGALGKAHIPVNEEIVPPGSRAFPVMSSSHAKPAEPIRGLETLKGSNASHDHGLLSHPVKHSGVLEKEERRGDQTVTPHKTPVSLLSATEDVTRTSLPSEEDKSRVNLEKPRGLEEDSAAVGGGLGSHGGVSNYQTKVTDPTGKAAGEIGASPTVTALGMRKGTGEDDQLGLKTNLPEKSQGFDMKSRSEIRNYGSGLGKEFPARSHEFDVKARPDFGKDMPIGTQGIRNPVRFDAQGKDMGDEMQQQQKQSSYTDMITSATSVVADKAVAAKNVVASKLGYSGEGDDIHQSRVGEEAPSSAGGYGSKVAGIVTPAYEKVKETGASVMTKLPFSSGGTGTETETQQGQDKGVSAREYLTEKLIPGEEDKVLSEVVAEKLHLGEAENSKKGTVTQSEEMGKRLGGFSDQRSEQEKKHGEAYAEEGEGGMVEKLRGAVTSLVSGTTEEAKQKSAESVQDSSQSLGSTVGTIGFPGSGGGEVGQRGGNSGYMPVQRRFQDSGN